MAVTRVARIEHAGVVPAATTQGQFLRFTVRACGPLPIFTLASSVKGTLWEAADFTGHPKKSYRWEHLHNPSDIQQMELLNMGFSFLSNARYTYVAELLDAAGEALRTVFEIEFEGEPTDTAEESLRILIQ